MEKGLRRLAKQCKDIKYTKGLLLGFLIAGTLSFSNSYLASLSYTFFSDSFFTEISIILSINTFKVLKNISSILFIKISFEYILFSEKILFFRKFLTV